MFAKIVAITLGQRVICNLRAAWRKREGIIEMHVGFLLMLQTKIVNMYML